MPEGSYSAGTIFLSVVPVFGDMMRSIERQAKDLDKALGDQAEESGRKAGERTGEAMGKETNKHAKESGHRDGKDYSGEFDRSFKDGLRKLNHELQPIKINVERNELRKEFAEIKAELKALEKNKLNVDLDAGAALAKAEILAVRLKALRESAKRVDVKVNLDEGIKGVDRFLARVKAAHPTITPELDQKKIDRDLGALREKFQRAGASAGKALAGGIDPEIDKVKAHLAELQDPDIIIHLDRRELEEGIAYAKAALERIRDQHVNLDVDTHDLDAAMEHLKTLDLKVNTTKATVELGAFERKIRESLKRASSAFGDGVSPEIDKIKAELETLSNTRIGIDLDEGEFFGRTAKLEERIKALSADRVNIGVDVDAAVAAGELIAMHKLVNSLDRDNVGIRVRIEGFGIAIAQLLGLKEAAKGAGGDANSSANAFRAFSFVILAVATLLPAIVPLLGAVGGALLALLPILASVGAGLGVAILGFSGIGKAVTALGAVHKAAAKDAETSGKKQAGAANSVADAERSLARAKADAAQGAQSAARAVADAERSAAESIKSALNGRADAARALTKANKDAAQAELDLRKAKILAQQDIRDLSNNVTQNKLDERQGVIDVFNATVANTNTQNDGSASNLQKEQSSIALEQARLKLKETREEQKQLAAEKKKADKEGVDGTDRVISAQEKVTQAIEGQQDAQRALGVASAAVDKARADGARQVADALRNQSDTAVRGAQSIADAQRGLARAQQSYRDSLKETAGTASAAQTQLDDAFSKLGPTGRKFALYIYSLRKGFYDIRDAAQKEMLPGVQAAMEKVINKYGPRFRGFVARMGRAVGDSFRATGRALTNPAFEGFFKTINKIGPKITRVFSRTLLNWMSVFARLATIAAPLGIKMANAMERISANALKFVNSKKGTDVFTRFMRYVAKVGPLVWSFLKDFAKAFIAIAVALAPLGSLLLGVLDGIFKFIDFLPPKVLGTILTAVLGLVIGIQLLFGAIAILRAGLTLLGEVLYGEFAFLLIPIAIFLAVGVALVVLYTQCKTFRDIVKQAMRVVGQVISFTWTNIIKPVLAALGKAFEFLWKFVIKPYLTFIGLYFKLTFLTLKFGWEYILRPVLKAIGAIFEFLWKIIVKPILGLLIAYWTFVFKAMAVVWNNILFPILDLFGHIVKKMWEFFIRPALRALLDFWQNVLGPAFKAAYYKYLKPILDKFGDAFGALRSRVGKVVGAIGDLWNSLKDTLAKPVNFVIKTILNDGLIKAFNKVATFVGSKNIPPIPLIGQKSSKGSKTPTTGQAGNDLAKGGHFAYGGVTPGYTPGRDVMSVHVSGGEAIMRPEWTRAIGKKTIDQWNKIARVGGVQSLKNHLYGKGEAGAFKNGGVVWPTTGHRISTYRGHDGVDINGPGQDYGNPIFAYRAGKIIYTGYGHGYGDAIFEQPNVGPRVVYGHGSKVLVHAGESVKAGQLIGRVGSTGNSSGPHLHFGVPGGTYDQALALLRGATNIKGGNGGNFIGSALGAVGGFFGKVLGNPIDYLKKAISKPLAKLGDSGFGKLLKGVTGKLLSGAGDKIKDLLSAGVGSVKSTLGGYGGVIRNALGLLHQPASLVGAVEHRLKQESGGNPRAINKTDINAQRGTPSVGLMQVIGPTFKRWAGRFAHTGPFIKGVSIDPLANIYAGLNYALHRYGNIKGPMLQPGGYAKGGIVPEQGPGAGPAAGGSLPDNGAMLYDDGGFLRPGLTTVVNLSGKPEPVFTNDQFRSMGKDDGSSKGDRTYAYSPTFVGTDLTANDVADDVLYGFRHIDNSGKYGRPGQ